MSENFFDLETSPRILFAESFSSKKKAIEALASVLAEQSEYGISDILEAFMNRERLGSTAIGNGIAIPHGRIDGLNEAMGVLIILENGLDLQAPDQQDVDIFFGLILPEECCNQHLLLLKDIASVASQDEALEMLRSEKSIETIHQWLSKDNPQLGVVLK